MAEPRIPQADIRRVRRRGGEWHVTLADKSTVVVPAVNEAPYTSRVSFGFTAGTLNARQVRR